MHGSGAVGGLPSPAQRERGCVVAVGSFNWDEHGNGCVREGLVGALGGSRSRISFLMIWMMGSWGVGMLSF